ncbi:hypothetical protein RUND412_009582 [Rhizina undulata]
MPFNNDDTSDLSTGRVSLPPPTSPDDRDRFRRGQDIIRDFNQDSFSSISARGGARDATDTVDSFDISTDALGVSTRHSEMLPHSPTIESRRLREEFKDFSMALPVPPEMTESSIEIGRAGTRDKEKDREDRLKPAEFSSQLPFSIGSATKSERSGKRSMFADFDQRRGSASSAHSDPSEYLTAIPRRSSNSANSRKSKEPTSTAGNNRNAESPLAQRSGSFPNFDLSALDDLLPKATNRNNASKTQQKQQQQSTQKGQSGAAKISEVVSNSGSGGSRKAPHDQYRFLQDEGEISDAGSISDRLRFTNARFGGPPTKRASPNNSIAGPSRSRFGTNTFMAAKISDEDLTSDVPALLAKPRKDQAAATEKGAAPKGFKSTDTFLMELGLGGNTTTIDFQEKLNALKDVGPEATRKNNENRRSVSSTAGPSAEDRHANLATSYGFTQQSFLLPQISDLSELISGYPGETTRYGRKRGYGAAKHYRPLESIPVPQDERALLMAMRLLQEKVTGLEESKAVAEQRCAKLEGELKNYEMKLLKEQRRARLAQESLQKKRSGDSAFGGSEDGDSEERKSEKAKLESQMERLRLESTVSDLRARNDEISRELDTAKIALRNMQEERNSAVNSVALAFSSKDDLKSANEKLKLDIYENNLRFEREREEWRVREDKYRRRLRDAKEAAAVAEEAMKEAVRRDTVAAETIERAKAEKREALAREREERERREKEQEEEERKQRQEQARIDFERKVEIELRKIRPDLFERRESEDESEVAPVSRKDSKGKNVVVEEVPEEPRPEVKQRPKVPKEPEKDVVIEEEQFEDDTIMSISPEEIRRIAREINEGRRKRKAAVKEANARAAHEKTEAEAAATRATASSSAANHRPLLKPKIRSRFIVPKPVSSDEPTTDEAPPVTVSAIRTVNPVPPIERQRPIKIPKSRKKILKPETVAGPSNSKTTGEVAGTQPETQGATQTQMGNPQAKKTKRIVKIVYYLNEDTARSFPLEKEIEEEIQGIEEALDGAKRPEPAVAEEETKKGEAQELVPPTTQTEELREFTAPLPHRQPTPAQPTVSFANPDLFERAQNAVNHQAVHDPATCTVCSRNVRMMLKEAERNSENPLADIDNSMAAPAPPLEPVSTRARARDGNISGIGFGAGFSNRSFDSEPTFRPSGEPKKQLRKVVKQMQDEFRHLKIEYEDKTQKFMVLDPAIEKRRRKALTREMNELVAEMDYKCDQIYALYDVNEEFVEESEDGVNAGLFEQETKEMEREIEIEREKEKLRAQREQLESEEEDVGDDATTEELMGRLPKKW